MESNTTVADQEAGFIMPLELIDVICSTGFSLWDICKP
jgi:hypothetical protein